jgi:hypothetical protein
MKPGEETRELETPPRGAVPLAREAAWRRIPHAAEPDPSATGPSPELQRRGERRTRLSLRVQRASIDPARDPKTGSLFFESAEDDETQNLSRRGVCLRCERPPEIGSRVLLQIPLPGEPPVDVVGLTRWARVEFVPGVHGARATAVVGLELLGGAPRALERYDRALGRIAASAALAENSEASTAVASLWDRR